MGQSYDSARGKKNGAARPAFRATANEVREDFDELRRDVSKLVGAAGDAARQEANQARDRIERLGRSVRDRATERINDMTARVREHPGTALGVTLGAGVLIGLMLSPHRRPPSAAR